MYRDWENSGADCGRDKYYQPVCEPCHQKKDGVINNTFVQMMEALGYDIEITYVKRKADGE